MASRILVAALLASGALARALPNGREVANVEARELTSAPGAVDTLYQKRSPQEEGGGGGSFNFGDYENQEEFWAEWDTEDAFFEEHGDQFESEEDFWQQLEAALPSEGGSGEGFSFGDYESQEDFWAEWSTEEAFFEEHGDQFESEDQFWEELEAALPSEGSSGGGEGDADEGPGGGFPGLPDEDFGFGGGDEVDSEFDWGDTDFGEEEGFPGPEEEPEDDAIIVIGPIED